MLHLFVPTQNRFTLLLELLQARRRRTDGWRLFSGNHVFQKVKKSTCILPSAVQKCRLSGGDDPCRGSPEAASRNKGRHTLEKTTDRVWIT